MRALVLLACIAAALSTGCADHGSAPPERSSTKRVRPVAGSLLDAAAQQPLNRQAVSVPAGGSKEIELDFGDVEAGSVIVLSDRPEDLSAEIGGVPLAAGDLLGAPTLFATLARPAKVSLVVTNDGEKAAAVEIELLGKSEREIDLEVEPPVVQPGQAVTFTATVTQPTDADVVYVVVGRHDKLLRELRPKRIDEGTWRTTFSATATGFYAVTARVEGGPPREISGLEGFEVAHAGTEITGFDELTTDRDRDGRIDYLVIRLRAKITASGLYLVDAGLGDRTGKPLPVGGGGGPLRRVRPGEHVFVLRWSAAALRAGGVPGPYRIVHVQLTRLEPTFRNETDIADLGRTRPYRLSDFDR